MKNSLTLLMTLAIAPAVGGASLSLDAERAVELALAASARRDAAAARVDAAAERAAAAAARRLPSLDLEAAAAYRSSVPEAAFPESIPDIGGFVLFPNIQDTWRAGVALSQPLWTGGAIAGSRRAAAHEQDAAAADGERVAAELRFEARSAYWRAVAAAAALTAAGAEVERAERLLEDARALRAAGMALRADELGAEARLAAARLRAIEAGADAATRLAELRSLLELPPATALELGDRGAHLPGDPAALEMLLAEAAANRPELASLAARAEALAGRAVAAAAPARPQVALAARWDLARPNERFLPLEDQWNTSWSVGLVAGWRVFDGGRTGAEAAAVDAERAVLEADRRELARRIMVEVETTRTNLEAALAATEAAEASVAAAAAREADGRERFQAGVATIAEVLDAQSELADAELALVRARSLARLADAGLLRAVGR